jgi:single-strand DNA-binding protein
MRDINSLNKVLLIGRLGRDPELRYISQTERAVANFNLATNERYFNPKTNEAEIRAEWHRIVAWGKLAEFCEKFLNQGKQILVEGKLRTRSWQDREGNKKYTTEVHAQNIILLGKKDEGMGEKSYQEFPTSSDFSSEERTNSIETEEDDEVPF